MDLTPAGRVALAAMALVLVGAALASLVAGSMAQEVGVGLLSGSVALLVLAARRPRR